MGNVQERQPVRGLTFEDVWALFQETDRRSKETDERFKETDRQIKETGEQLKEIGERFKETDDRFKETDALIKETGRQMRETDKQLKETIQETNKQLKETMQETDKQIRQNQKMMSDLGRKFGKIIEHMLIPNLKEKFNALGFVFEKSSPNVIVENSASGICAEIDVFLENGDCALAVEVKTQANTNDVQEHVERMEKLRRYFDLHNDRRKLYGAVAAAIFQPNVLDFALKKGFYVIEQSGDNVSVRKPEGEVRAW
ncbi:MAG: hypothetical protein LBB61_09505 [Treponema sp.]|jgi:hypothetical protein|nr:hypothetical protein [Treponema sp.]